MRVFTFGVLYAIYFFSFCIPWYHFLEETCFALKFLILKVIHPLVFPRCVRNGNYDEALDLEAFVGKLSTMHPKLVCLYYSSLMLFPVVLNHMKATVWGFIPLHSLPLLSSKVTSYSSTGCRSEADHPVSSFSASPETSFQHSGILSLSRNNKSAIWLHLETWFWRFIYSCAFISLFLAVTRMPADYRILASNWSLQRVWNAFSG